MYINILCNSGLHFKFLIYLLLLDKQTDREMDEQIDSQMKTDRQMGAERQTMCSLNDQDELLFFHLNELPIFTSIKNDTSFKYISLLSLLLALALTHILQCPLLLV